VFDEDWNEGLDWCIDEFLSGFLTPALDLGGSLLVAKPLVTGQLVCDVGDPIAQPLNGWPALRVRTASRSAGCRDDISLIWRSFTARSSTRRSLGA
jgi:hypothetical protein